MQEPGLSYFFNRSERSVFVEIYFPKRAAYYGSIFDALRYGYEETEVKAYLKYDVGNLVEEFKAFPALFDPDRYSEKKPANKIISVDEAIRRIEMYSSPFFGWSVYSVDGVFFDADHKPIEEATQVVRIMFRFQSSFISQAVDEGCLDVLRAILFWVIPQQGRLSEHAVWSKEEQAQFIKRHQPWPKHKLAFAKKHFQAIALEAGKWVDDRALFVFAYLVRKFWQRVVTEKMREDEIWVTGLFDVVLNVVKPNTI